MSRHEHKDIMNNSQENISPGKTSYDFTAGPEKLNHARDLMQKRFYGGRERNENLRMG